MTELIAVPKVDQWSRLKALVLDSVSSPITRRVYNLGLNEFFAWHRQEPRAGFTKATVAAWRVALEARGLGAVSINVRITAVRKLAVEAADNALLAPELASGITRVKGVASKGIRLGNWLSARQAQILLNTPDVTTPKGLRDRAIPGRAPGLRVTTIGSSRAHDEPHPTEGRALVHRGPRRQARPGPNGADADLGEGRDRCVDFRGGHNRGSRFPGRESRRPSQDRRTQRESRLAVAPGVRRRSGGAGHRPARPSAYVREAVPGGRRRVGADSVTSWSRFCPDHGALPRDQTGSGERTERRH
jgi:hypothetical protein